MNKLRHLFVLLALATLTLLPLQAAQASGLDLPTQDGGVIIGSSYVLADGETLSGGMVVIGGSARLEKGSTFYGDLVVIGGSSTVEEGAEVNGAVVTIGGSLTIDTEVKGDVVSIGGPTLLEKNTHIRGDLVTIGGPIQKEDGAQVDGELIDNPTPPTRPGQPEINIPAVDNPRFDVDVNPFWEAFWLFTRSIGYGLLAMLIVLFLPQQTRRVSEAAVRQPLAAGGMGILTHILFVVVIVALALFSVLIITLIVTIPLIVVVSLALGAGMAFGWIALGTEVGVRLTGLFNREWPLPASAALGTFLMTLVAEGIGFVPCVGWIVPLVLALLGVGAVAMTRFGTQAAALPASQAEVEYIPPSDPL
ncbi:MAG: hypothetical protein CVU44_16540 [Chloroflexi bacterium HGW-Chloroflexi-6]|nr:MAG: hypothetical protein CVU44_16540 [Chloroflexi bacterium HGW-Chloroflexi-6]